MKGPCGFQMNSRGKMCKLAGNGPGFFGQLPASAIKDFNAIKTTATYPRGALLFLERQEARGVYVLCEGEVKLTVSSAGGRNMIMRIAKAGEVLGLMAAISNQPYEVSAETIRPCLVSFVRRGDFLRFLGNHSEASQNVVKQMSSQYSDMCEQLRTVKLCASVRERLAHLLLTWSEGIQETKEGMGIKLPLTHEEIAEFIGATRESVTRTLSAFKLRHLVVIKGATLMIPNRSALETFAGMVASDVF